MLGRAAARRKEIAVRLALGAGRGRLIRQLLTESLVLAVAGGAAGVLLAVWLTGTINPLLSRLPVPIEFDLRLDGRVLVYTLGLTTLTAFTFGLAPARRVAGFELVSSLKDETAGLAGRQRLRRLLVVGQVTVSTALLVWSGLFLRSLGHIATIDPGFDDEGVVLGRIELDEAVHDSAFGLLLARNLQQAVEQSAGVTDAGIATVVPLSLENEEFDIIRVDDDGRTPAVVQRVLANRLTPGWFQTVRVPLLAGRDFRWSDDEGAPAVAIVNETLARRFWNGNALGRHARIPGPRGRVLEIVGVVRDSKYWTLGEAISPTIYLPYEQSDFRMLTLHVRAADMRSASAAITRAARTFAPDLFVDVTPMSGTTAIAALPARIGAAATAAFGLLALILATLGVYGLVAFTVAQRRREIAIRRAIGATASHVIRQVIGEHAALTLTGMAAGLVLGGLGGLVFRGFIAGVSPLDAVTFAAVTVTVAAAAVLGSALPTLRASLVSPTLALRES
jgi:predicted permease